MGVATGMEKVESVIGALNSHYLDVIIIDESTAAAVLERVTK
ncbi:sugar-binding domain-containing protein [Metabacillus litoralis]|nr:sugar-binding domain-containing protein [Metabacillus litoralis]